MNIITINPTGIPDVDTLALQTALNSTIPTKITLGYGRFALGKRALRAAVRRANSNIPVIIEGSGSDGRGTELILVDMAGGSGGDTHGLSFEYSKNIILRNFVISTNRALFPNFSQQSAGLYFNGCEQVTIENIHTKDSIKDGFYFLGQAVSQNDALTRGLRIINTTHYDAKRAGMAFQGGVLDVVIDGLICYGRGMDTEPTGDRLPADNFILRNAKFYPTDSAYTLSISGLSSTSLTSFLVENVEIENGSLWVYNAYNVQITGLKINGRKDRPPMTVRGKVDNLSIVDSIITTRDYTTQDGAISLGSHNSNYPGMVRIVDTDIICAAPRMGVQASDVNYVELDNCNLYGGNSASGVYVINISRFEGIRGLSIQGGTINRYAQGVQLRAYSNRKLNTVITNTKINNCTTGVYSEGASNILTSLLDNTYESVTFPEYSEG